MTDVDLLLDLSGQPQGPLHDRIRRALRDRIRSGQLALGTVLPPSRQLAGELRCSRWVVTEAYNQLVAEGYLSAVRGSGTRVAWPGGETPAPDVVRPRARAEPPARYDLAPGSPDLRAFPRKQWADALRTETLSAADADFGAADPQGHARLRRTLAAYVVRTRGAVAAADDVVVGASVTELLRPLCRLLRSGGITSVGVEDPGWPRLWGVISDSGLEVVHVPVDERGLRVDELRHRNPDLRVVLVTPAHQFPTGTVMSPNRRVRLATWAEEVDGLVLEDDYDAEYRYDRDPVSSFQGMAPTRTIMLKSVSKVLSPSLGLGWMVLPPTWLEALERTGGPRHVPPTLDQLALARMIDSGWLDRHLRTGRLRYRRRRDVLVGSLAAHLPYATVTGMAAGLHLLIMLPVGSDTDRLVAAASARGVAVVALDRYQASPGTPPGLVLGYGNISDSSVEPAVIRLAEAAQSIGLVPRHDGSRPVRSGSGGSTSALGAHDRRSGEPSGEG